jgi:hypothetical protein
MQNDPSSDSVDVPRVVKSGIHDRLIDPANPRPFAVRELVLEISDPLDVEDALADLHSVGSVHRCGEFVWLHGPRS